METARVLKKFGWGGGWTFAPKDGCDCQEPQGNSLGCGGCTHIVGSSCVCQGYSCHCVCGIPAWRYGGDILLIQEGHPRKERMYLDRKIIADASIPPADELLADPKYKRLLFPPAEERGPVRTYKRKPVAA